MIAVNWSMPNMPRFEIENVEPVYSSGLSFRSRARLASSRRFGGDLAHALPVGVEDHRHDQPVVRRDGHAEVDAVVVADAVAEPVRVHFGMLRERGGDGLHEDVVDRDLELVAHLEHRGAQLGDAREVEVGGEIEGRDRADRFGETLGDRLSDLRERDVLEVDSRLDGWTAGAADGRGRRCRRRLRCRA